MAKQQSNDSSEVKKLLEGLYKIVQTTNSQSKEQTKINKELLKVMAVLEAGFAKNEEDARKLIDDVREGLEIQDEYVIRFAKARDKEQKDVDKLLKKFRELEQIHEDEIDNAEDYLDLLTDRYDVMDDEYDITQKLLSSQKQILKIIQDNKRVYEKIGGSAININDQLSKIIKKKVDLESVFAGSLQSFELADQTVGKIDDDIQTLIKNANGNIIDFPFHFNPLSSDLDKEIQKVSESINMERSGRIKGLEEYYNKNKKYQTDLARSFAASYSDLGITVDVDTGDITKGLDKIRKGSAEYETIINQLDDVILKNNIGDKVAESFGELTRLLDLGTYKTEAEGQALEELLKPMGLANKLLVEQVQLQLDSLDGANHHLAVESSKYKILIKNLDLLQSTESTVRKIGNGFDYISSLLPSGVSEFLGLKNVSAQLMSDHQKGIETLTKKLMDGETRASALRGYLKDMGPSIKSALSPMTLLVAGGILLYKYVESVTGKLKEMSHEMEISLSQSNQLMRSQLSILTAQENQFATLKDIERIQTEMIGSSGKFYSAINKGNQQTIISIAEMGKVFGYGVTEATKIHKVFSDLGADDKLAQSLQTNLGLISEMAGLSPQIVGKDLVESSEIVYTYFAGMPEQAAKAAINVRKLGMSLKQAGSIAQKMLNLEEFMTDMYELNAMSSRTIDFGKAFDLGLMGDVEGMTKEIMNNIGSTAEFNNMDYLTRTKIAKTLGMSMDDLSKSVKMHEQMANFSGKEKEILEGNIDRMGDISKLNKDQIRERLQQLQSTDRLAIAWDKIKGVLIKSLLPLVEVFADGIDAIMPLIETIIGLFKIVGLVVKPIAIFIKGMLVPLGWVGDLINKINEMFFSTSDAVGGITSKLGGLEPILKTIGTIFGTWYFSKKLMGGFGMLKSESKGVTETLSPIGSIFSNIFSSKKPITDVQTITDATTTAQKVVDINAKQIIQSVNNQTQTASKQIESSASKAGTEIEKVKKKSSGLFSNLGAKPGFGIAKDIATKTLAMIAIDQARTFMGFGKTAADGIESNKANIESAMSGAFSVGGILLSGYLDQAMTKVFEKNLEKKFDKGMEPLVDKAKGRFEKIADFGKKLLSPFSSLEQNIEQTETNKSIDKEIVSDKQEKVKKIEKTIISEKTIDKTVVSKKIIETPEIITKEPNTKPIDKLKTIFTTIETTIKKVWSSIKGTLLEIVDFVVTVTGKLSKGIGDIISNLLGGIADGLNKFTTNAIKGAASLLIVSGALWITSKAMENFAKIPWDGIAKGIVTLGGLVIAANLIGKSSTQMIIGAVGIGILGASLIPLVYAMEKFNKVEWSGIAKAATAIIGLGIIGTVLSPLTPTMIIAAAGIAVLGASLIPLAYSLKMLNDVEWSSISKGIMGLMSFGAVGTIIGIASPFIIAGSVAIMALSGAVFALSLPIQALSFTLEKIPFENVSKLTNVLTNLTSVSSIELFGIAGGIMAISASLLAFGASNLLSGITSKIGGNIIADLKDLSTPLESVTDSILILSQGIQGLGQALTELDFSKLENIKPIGSKIDFDISKKMDLVKNEEQTISFDQKFNPVKTSTKPLPPTKESTAQNINVQKIVEKHKELETERQVKMQEEMEYSSDGINNISTRKMENLLQQLIEVITATSDRPLNVNLDTYALNNSMKRFNNK